MTLTKQICYIGPNEEPVPSRPTEAEAAKSREATENSEPAKCEHEHSQHMKEEVEREAQAIKEGTSRYLEVVKANREAKEAEKRCP